MATFPGGHISQWPHFPVATFPGACCQLIKLCNSVSSVFRVLCCVCVASLCPLFVTGLVVGALSSGSWLPSCLRIELTLNGALERLRPWMVCDFRSGCCLKLTLSVGGLHALYTRPVVSGCGDQLTNLVIWVSLFSHHNPSLPALLRHFGF